MLNEPSARTPAPKRPIPRWAIYLAGAVIVVFIVVNLIRAS